LQDREAKKACHISDLDTLRSDLVWLEHVQLLHLAREAVRAGAVVRKIINLMIVCMHVDFNVNKWNQTSSHAYQHHHPSSQKVACPRHAQTF